MMQPAPPRNRKPQTTRVPVLGALVALVWLSVAVLPATRPNQGGATYFGAALIAVVAGAGIVMLTSQLRLRAAATTTLADALAPILALTIGSVVLGGLAYALKDASPVLQDAFTWAAELGGLATLIAVVPLPASDGARALRVVLGRRRTPEQVEAGMARSVKAAGFFVAVVGLGVAGFLDIGLGILAIALGWLTLASSRMSTVKLTLDSSLAGLYAGDVAAQAQPVPSWRPLNDVLAERNGWPLGVGAVPVVDWSGEPAGVLVAAAAERAMKAAKGDERVSALAIPAALVPTVEETVPASSLVQLLAGTAGSVAVVTRDGHPIGTVSGVDLQNAARTNRLRPSRAGV